MKKITLIFKNGDTIEVDAEGFTGDKCIKTTDEIIDILNPRLIDRKLKPEYYRAKAAASEYEGI
ncbi:MAG TPA: DUF2997 domain-containing protein [Thermoprotei archaeon]|mgnify:CR=1 FL=1|nr:DUF2997 domain-containing protein [Thermoprotei archaeon]